MSCPHCGSHTHPSANLCPVKDKDIRSVQIAPSGLSDKETERQLKWYQKAKEEGHQPWSTSIDHKTGYLSSELAMAIADQTGEVYNANDMVGSIYPDVKDKIKPLTKEQKDAARTNLTRGT
jgi:hypothetical protein